MSLFISFMTETEMKIRTKSFALRILKLIEALPETRSGRIVANQLGRSGTSVGANYRAACRAKSTADMIAKLSIVEEESDESAFWLEIVPDAELLPAAKTEACSKKPVNSRRSWSLRVKRSSETIENRNSKIENLLTRSGAPRSDRAMLLSTPDRIRSRRQSPNRQPTP